MERNAIFIRCIAVATFLILVLSSVAQSSSNQSYFQITTARFTLPPSTSGLTDPGLTVWGKFKIESIGEKKYLYLTTKFEHSTPSKPGPGFWFRYKAANGKIYTDKEIGSDPFQSITFYGAKFSAKVVFGIHSLDISLSGNDIPNRISEVPKDFDIKSANVYVNELIGYNIDASAIRNAIAKYEQGLKDKENESLQKEKQKVADQNTATTADDFWSEKGTKSTTATQFSGGLDDIEEGGYFKDDKGNYFRKEGNIARMVAKSEYDRDLVQKSQARNARQAQIREQNLQMVNQAVDAGLSLLTTSFYAQQLGDSMKEATQLGSDFENIDELNAVFQQKMAEIAELSTLSREAQSKNLDTYITAQMMGASSEQEQAVVGAIGVLGSVVGSLSADRAEQKARAELNIQRRKAAEEIMEREREIIVAIRNEIGNTFPEGGMPLSMHKVDAPILYLFAYSGNRTQWEKGQVLPFTVSNVIPVYRYDDGSYPYSSYVKRIFEAAGVNNPIIVGYFTDRRQAEKYRNSLINIAPNAKFNVAQVEVRVKEKDPTSNQNTNADTDFWNY